MKELNQCQIFSGHNYFAKWILVINNSFKCTTVIRNFIQSSRVTLVIVSLVSKLSHLRAWWTSCLATAICVAARFWNFHNLFFNPKVGKIMKIIILYQIVKNSLPRICRKKCSCTWLITIDVFIASHHCFDKCNAQTINWIYSWNRFAVCHYR